jgi:hypothetical protein
LGALLIVPRGWGLLWKYLRLVFWVWGGGVEPFLRKG